MSKIVLNVLTRRLESKAELYLGKDQYDFRRGCVTRDAIAAMRVSCDRSLEHNNRVYYICYVDYEKAFDRVNSDKLMTILKVIGVDWKDRRLIWNLYQRQSASVQVGNGLSAACQMTEGLDKVVLYHHCCSSYKMML